MHITHNIEDLPNNLITQNHSEGAMLLRWINCEDPIIPEVTKIKLSELK
jgi:hypothetical protein